MYYVTAGIRTTLATVRFATVRCLFDERVLSRLVQNRRTDSVGKVIKTRHKN